MNRPLFALACVLLLMAAGSILLGFVMSVQSVTLHHVQVPPRAVVHIDQPGTWLLWQAAPAVAPPKSRVSLAGLPVLIDPAGAVVEVAPTIRTIRFTKGDETFVVRGRYEVDTPGDWYLSSAAGQEAHVRSWAIGLDPLPLVKVWSLFTVSAAIILVGTAACTGWISLRRPSNRALPSIQSHLGG